MTSITLAVLKLILPAGTAAEPAATAPVTPCAEPIAFWWDASAFHAGEKAWTWSELGTSPTNGASFRVRYGVVDREPVDLVCTLDLSRPRFEIGSFGVIGNAAISNRIRVVSQRDGTMRSYFVAQGQTPDFINHTKSFPVRKGVPAEITIAGRGSSSGDSWHHLYDTDGTELYQSGCTYHDPKLVFDYQYLWTDTKRQELHVVTQNWTDGLPGDYTIRIAARDLRTNTLGTWTKTAKMRRTYGKEDYVFDVSDLAEGFYMINVDYLDGDGHIVHSGRAPLFRPPEKTLWEGNRIGLEDTVPPPWTKPEYSADGRFECWNRVYRLGGRGLVSSIVNGTSEMLADPVAVVCDGRPLEFDCELAESRASSCTYRLRARGTDVTVLAVCEFDGLVSFTLEYGAGVKSLRWRMPLRREGIVSFDDGTGPDKDVFGRNGAFDRTLDLNRSVWWWAGGVKGMMCGLYSLRGTRVKDYAKAARAWIADGRFTMEQTIVDTPYDGADRRRVKFYLCPTPVKPKNLEFASLPTDRIVGWTGHVNEYFEIKYPGFELQDRYDRFRRDIAEGRRVFWYNAATATSWGDPLWNWYGREWVTRGATPDYYAHEAPIAAERRKECNWTYACLNSSYFDYKVWGVYQYLNGYCKEMKDLYFDLSNPNQGCPNAVHGCRFTDDFGRTLCERGLEKMREFQKRCYRIVKAKNADGLMFGHVVNARCPSDNFFDYVSTGESLAIKVSRQDSYYDIFTPDMVQAMFASKAVDRKVECPPQFLRWRQCWDPIAYRPENYNCREPKLDRAIRHFCAYAKIHDLQIPRKQGDREGDQFHKVEGPISSMGRDCVYSSYCTDGEKPVALSNPGERQLWAYFRNAKESILVVLNDTDAEVAQTVSVRELSAKGTELIDGTAFDFTSGACTLKLGPRGARFIRFVR